MTIEDRDTVDIIASRPDSSVVKLIVSDHLDWRDVHAHQLAIQEKVNAYVAFLESGQLHRVQEPRIPEDPELCIVVAMLHRPPAEVERFLEEVRVFLSELSIRFEVDHALGPAA